MHDDNDGSLILFTNLPADIVETTTYDWYFGDGDQSADKNPTHKYTNNSSFYARLITYNTDKCFNDTTVVITITSVSVNDLGPNGQASIYPVPATNQLTIDSFEKSKIEIFNTAGQKILSFVAKNQLEYIDVSQFAKGVYFIKIENAESTSTKKLIIE